MRGSRRSIRNFEDSTYSPGHPLFRRPSEEEEAEEETEEILFKLDKRKKSKKKDRILFTKDFIYFGPKSSTIFSIDNVEKVYPNIEKKPKNGYANWVPFINEPEEEKIDYKIYRSSKVKIQDKTIASYIFKVLLKAKKPLHINDISILLKRNKLLKIKKAHIYSTIYSAIIRNNFLFKKTGKATFTLRKGFLKLEAPIKIGKEIDNDLNIPSLKELVIDMIKQISPDEMMSCPKEIFNSLISFGYNGSYKSIYKTLQNPCFIKVGDNYKLSPRQ